MVLFEKDELKLLWPFYLDAFLGVVFFIFLPFEVLYFIKIGFSLTQIGILNGALALFMFLFEVPTGAIADIYGRRFSVLTGFLFDGILLGLIYFFTNYFSILVIFCLLGISRTLSSGSFDAWIVDLLKEKRREDLVKNYFSKWYSIEGIGIFISGLLGALIVSNFGLQAVWAVTGFGGIFSAITLFITTKESKSSRGRAKKESVYLQCKKSIQYGYAHPVLFVLFSASILLALFNTFSASISWTPLLSNAGLTDSYFGYLFSILGVFGAIASFASAKITPEKKERNMLVFTAIISLLCGILVILNNNLISFAILYCISSSIYGFEYPIWNTYFQRFIPSNMRATIGSARNMLYSIIGVVGLPLAGFLVDNIGSKYTILISGLLMIPVIILYLSIKENSSKNI